MVAAARAVDLQEKLFSIGAEIFALETPAQSDSLVCAGGISLETIQLFWRETGKGLNSPTGHMTEEILFTARFWRRVLSANQPGLYGMSDLLGK